MCSARCVVVRRIQIEQVCSVDAVCGKRARRAVSDVQLYKVFFDTIGVRSGNEVTVVIRYDVFEIESIDSRRILRVIRRGEVDRQVAIAIDPIGAGTAGALSNAREDRAIREINTTVKENLRRVEKVAISCHVRVLDDSRFGVFTNPARLQVEHSKPRRRCIGRDIIS